jgi:hypothetical protein
MGHGSAMIIGRDIFGRILLNKKHLYLSACHVSFKILQQFFYFKISKSLNKTSQLSHSSHPELREFISWLLPMQLI